MDATIDTRFRNFMRRAAEMGLHVTAEPHPTIPGRYRLLADTSAGTGDGQSYKLLGLAFHFINRSWAGEPSYTYIVKNSLGLTFYGGETDDPNLQDAACRWRQVGTEHDNVAALSREKDVSKWPWLVNQRSASSDTYTVARYDAQTQAFTTEGGEPLEHVHRYAAINDERL